MQIREVSIDDEEYPDLLRYGLEPPATLWVAGRDLRDLGPFVAVIGARRATQYGVDVAHRLAAGIALSGIGVVSGMARGVDAAAHRGALSVDGKTVAALGCGPDVCYPVGSQDLYERMITSGAIVAEHPPGTQINRKFLKDRNRILVGMSHAVVVVQGDAHSAAVATGKAAAELGRELFAVPGSVDWPMSVGVHALLKDGAHICTSADDVVGLVAGTLSAQRTDLPVPPGLPSDQQIVLETLSEGAANLDTVVRRTGLDAASASRAAGALEIKGLLRRVGTLLDRVR